MIYVGIVTYNSHADLPACFSALSHQTVIRQMKIIVLDNCSDDATVTWIQGQGTIAHLIQSTENVGFGRGHNHIIQSCNLSNDDFYLALNPDVTLAPDYIMRVVETIQRTQAGWGIGKLLSSETETPTFYSAGHALLRGGYAFNIGYGMGDAGQYDTEREIFGAAGAAVILSGCMINALTDDDGALFEPNFFLYYEDVDLDWVARRRGWRCWYQSDAIAYHRGSNPPDWLRDEALCNRYLSVIKNAYGVDLLLYNLPLITAHFSARLLMNPVRGWRLLRAFWSKARTMGRRRSPNVIARSEMMVWFRWSRAQATNQPVSVWKRFWSRVSAKNGQP